MPVKLTAKQKKFVEAYAGNGTEAARQAGYSGSDATLAQTAYELLRKPEIKSQIDARQQRAVSSLVAAREERQAMWTATMRDVTLPIRDRLRASELLGKSEGDFIDKVEVSGKLRLEDLVAGTLADE
jgi:phage terminase small subunit